MKDSTFKNCLLLDAYVQSCKETNALKAFVKRCSFADAIHAERLFNEAESLCNSLYLEYINDFLSVSAFCEYHEFSKIFATDIVGTGRKRQNLRLAKEFVVANKKDAENYMDLVRLASEKYGVFFTDLRQYMQ